MIRRRHGVFVMNDSNNLLCKDLFISDTSKLCSRITDALIINWQWFLDVSNTKTGIADFTSLASNV